MEVNNDQMRLKLIKFIFKKYMLHLSSIKSWCIFAILRKLLLKKKTTPKSSVHFLYTNVRKIVNINN